MELKLLNYKRKLKEWLNVGKLAGPADYTSFKKEISLAVAKGSKHFEYGLPFYFEEDNKIIGTAMVKKTEFDTYNSIGIFHVAIIKSERGKKLGKELMFNIFRYLKSKRIRFVHLFTTTAGGFYKKCGMSKYGEFPNLIQKGMSRKFYYKELY